MQTLLRISAQGAAQAVAQLLRQQLEAIDVYVCAQQSNEPVPVLVLFTELDETVLHRIRESSAAGEIRVLAIDTGERAYDARSHWAILQAGASDVMRWRDDLDVAAAIRARVQRWLDIDALLQSSVVCKNLIGGSSVWRQTLRQLIEAARYSDATVLISGESGTGKELAARLIHTLDARSQKGELVTLDCTTIVSELSGSELFGHERGAFTGAIGARDGAFALAHGGTLFLDEVGELPATLQAQLLRVIQERTYKRVGGNQWLQTNFRLICATNRNLQAEVGSGAFRGDLYYRIANWNCELPSLRQRGEDILPLVTHFWSGLKDGAALEIEPAVRDYLLHCAWPGNVRELRQIVTRIAARHVGPGPVTIGDLPEKERGCLTDEALDWRDGDFETAIRRALGMGMKLKELSQYAAETAVRLVVSEENGNLQRAARRLGVTDRALQLRRASQPLSIAH